MHGLIRSDRGSQRVRRTGCSLVLVVTLFGCSATHEPAVVKPDSGDRRASQVDTILADEIGEGPGCAVAVGVDGQPLLQRARGYADVAAGVPIDGHTVFDIASVSKQMTAGVVMVLVVEDGLAMDATLDELLDGLPAWSKKVTVGDLIHHTSGIPDYTEFLGADEDVVTTNADAISVLVEQDELTMEPGTAFEYSNSNYLLLSQIAEAWTGRTFPEVAAELVFDPAGMDETRVRDDQGDLDPGQAQGYRDDGDGPKPVRSSWRQTGDGAVHTTVTDLLVWASLLTSAPRTRGAGSVAWRDRMLEPGRYPDGEDQYGGGLVMSNHGKRRTVSHDGSWVGVSSSLVVDLESHVAVAVACNLEDVDAAGISEAVLDAWSATG